MIGMERIKKRWMKEKKIELWYVMGVDIWVGKGYIMKVMIVGIIEINNV